MPLFTGGASSTGAVVEWTVVLPQLRLVSLRGHCRAHSRRCATTDGSDVIVAVTSRV